MRLDKNSQQTQRKITVGTYKKIARYLKGNKCLDYGAGLMEGTKHLNQIINTDSYEPFPKEGINPTYTCLNDIPDELYDHVVCNCVLNIIEDPGSRNETITKIFQSLKPGGTAFIMVRSKSSVCSSAKTATCVGDCEYKHKNGSFQKGFTKLSLKSLIESSYNGDIQIRLIRNIAPIGYIITKR